MADPHFMYRQEHQNVNPSTERKKIASRSWAKRIAGVLFLVGAIGLTAYSFASVERPLNAVSINATQTEKGAVIVIATNTGSVWVNSVECDNKVSSTGCKSSSWLNLEGSYDNPSIAARSGSKSDYYIVALGRDGKAYSTNITCTPQCIVAAGKTSPAVWAAIPNQPRSWSQVVAVSPLSPPADATCDATLLLEKEGSNKAYYMATCSNGANSGEIKEIVYKKRGGIIDANNRATQNLLSAYTVDNFGRQIILENKQGTVSMLGSAAYNEVAFVREESVVAIPQLRESAHPVTIQGLAGISRVSAYGIRKSNDIGLFKADATGVVTDTSVLTSIKDQKELYSAQDGFILKDENNDVSFAYPNPAVANSVGGKAELGKNLPLTYIVDHKIFAINDTGEVLFRTYQASKDATGTVIGLDRAKSQDWAKL